MKKTILTLISAFMAFSTGLAQNTDNIVAQPTHVVGKRIDANGEVIKEYVADFTYYDDGKLAHYYFPEFSLNANFHYSDDYLIKEDIFNYSGHPISNERTNYTYENGKVKTIAFYDYWEDASFWLYTYNDSGRIERIDFNEDTYLEYHTHWLYDYEDEGKTVIESYCTSWAIQGWVLWKKTTKHYDDSYQLLTYCTENYNEEGEMTSSALAIYAYTPEGKQESVVNQTLVDGEWVNTKITQYAYDDNGRLIEQTSGTWDNENGEWVSTSITQLSYDDADCLNLRLEGVWDNENGEWYFNRKITYEYSEDGATYTVSFYKKNGGEWVWNTFSGQTVLFGNNLKNQQRMINRMVNDPLCSPAHINQIEFTLEYMEEPFYLHTEERTGLSAKVYPNPSSGIIRVESPTNDAVIRFYDLQGKLMLARPFDFGTEINAESWPSGVYLWEIWHDNQKEVAGKWVKK